MPNVFTGRIDNFPEKILHDEILEPQFIYEVENLLEYYINIEQVMLLEYVKMICISKSQGAEINEILKSITKEILVASPENNMSDILFAIEKHVENSLTESVPFWHADRSRNDVQACAQLMFARQELLELITKLGIFIEEILNLAKQYTDTPMPGYTHFQSAQIITPGFYLSAMADELIQIHRNWMHTYDNINRSPLTAGAMAGVELDWNSESLASLLGFRGTSSNALKSVASRQWILQISAELSVFSVLISRFLTDLMLWGSSEYHFIDLPGNLSGISSAMPQKKNFPIIERIRGKCSHVAAFHNNFILGQKNTPYTNLVETSKESTTYFIDLSHTSQSILTLLTLVIQHLSFNKDKMLHLCKKDYFGGFSLANFLTIRENIPYRKSQVITGRYIMEAMRMNLSPEEYNVHILEQKCAEEGFSIHNPTEILALSFDVENNLNLKKSHGSTNPSIVQKSIDFQLEEVTKCKSNLMSRLAKLSTAESEREDQLSSFLN
ncbi:argininosuccinate lyase [Paenibacillus pabuli]|uniref:argininosuccinate lyase n=1 Tax=Paenibacillus pabuli TaxID=1472 RepID=UPI000784940B|nr:lyase family protein [Paenibacillus pabuli]MEC0126206.1 lyase family protein [Paenibacillus pabuli]